MVTTDFDASYVAPWHLTLPWQLNLASVHVIAIIFSLFFEELVLSFQPFFQWHCRL